MDVLQNSTRAGTLGGTLLVVIFQINTEEVLKTVVLAATGAAVSFLVTLLLKWITTKAKGDAK